MRSMSAISERAIAIEVARRPPKQTTASSSAAADVVVVAASQSSDPRSRPTTCYRLAW